jgi:hypothetical protein
MADTNLASIAGALKRVYDKNVNRLQNLEARAMNEIAKSSKNYSPGGEGFFGDINDQGNESVGAINEEEQFRTIDSENYQQFKVTPKVLVAPIQFSGLASKAAESEDEAFVNVVMDAMERARDRLTKDENRQFYGLGTGQLATAPGTVASNLLSFTVDSAQYLRANQVIDIFHGATKTVISLRVQYVDKVNSVVGFATSIGAALAAGDVLVKEHIRDNAAADGKEMMGLRGICDDGTELTTFQNLSAASNMLWRGRRIDAGGGNVTSDIIQRLIDDVAVLSGTNIDTLIMHRKQRRKYLDIVVPQKRYAEQKMDSGFQKLEFNGLELWLDVDCQDDRIYALSKKEIQKFELCAMEVGTHDGSDKFLRATNFDLYQSYWRHYCNIGTGMRNAFGALVNLGKPAGVA